MDHREQITRFARSTRTWLAEKLETRPVGVNRHRDADTYRVANRIMIQTSVFVCRVEQRTILTRRHILLIFR